MNRLSKGDFLKVDKNVHSCDNRHRWKEKGPLRDEHKSIFL